MYKIIEAIKLDKYFYLEICTALFGIENIYNCYDSNDYTVEELADELAEEVDKIINSEKE